MTATPASPMRSFLLCLMAATLLLLSPLGWALDRMEERVAPCAACHGAQGRSQAETYYPSIAGKPALYLFHQLQNFREGRRQHRVMTELLSPLSEEYLWQMAQYYAAQSPAQRPPGPPLSAEQKATAEGLVLEGDPRSELPACTDCHGQALQGMLPGIPGLTGLDAEYITAQLGAWKAGVRGAAEPDCMAQIAQRLDAEQISAVASWISSRPSSTDSQPEAAGTQPLPLDCFAPAPQKITPLTGQGRDVPLERGEYLLRAGNCMGCHSARGGPAWAGGRPISTPFGAVYSSNLTPDPDTGLGGWSAEDFWRALTQGIGADGRLLYPAFPYTHYQRIRREDSDAMWASLQALPAVRQPRPAHALRFPFNTQWALRVWRWLYFKAPQEVEAPGPDPDWERGRYLVEGLGHCSACHGRRDLLGGLSAQQAFAGSLLPDRSWFAPPLARQRNAQERENLVQLLSMGSSAHRASSGPMAEVVKDSLQHLREEDIRAMVVYLDSLPEVPATALSTLGVSEALMKRQMREGKKLYADHCADCHGEQGQGEAWVYPALKDNRAVLAASPANAIRSLKFGGYGPSTQGHPYPFGMPPFAQNLSAEEMAAVLSYVRNAWGNSASAVSPVEVGR
ncbi:MAG: c-type cytochrome [Oceanococcaceae bacterium]